MSLRVKAIIGIVLVVLIGIVILQNSGPVALRFLFWRADIDAVLLYLGLFASGVVIGLLGGYALRRRGATAKPR